MYRPPPKEKPSLFNWLISQIQKQKKRDNDLIDSLNKMSIKK